MTITANRQNKAVGAGMIIRYVCHAVIIRYGRRNAAFTGV